MTRAPARSRIFRQSVHFNPTLRLCRPYRDSSRPTGRGRSNRYLYGKLSAGGTATLAEFGSTEPSSGVRAAISHSGRPAPPTPLVTFVEGIEGTAGFRPRWPLARGTRGGGASGVPGTARNGFLQLRFRFRGSGG